MKGLSRKEVCPIHRSRTCCGRSQENAKPRRQPSGPARKIDDPHHPRGYREMCSPAEMRRRKAILVRKQNNRCAIGGEEFTDFRLVEIDHIEPRGMGGSRRDDSWENIRAVCHDHNFEKGSKRENSLPSQ